MSEKSLEPSKSPIYRYKEVISSVDKISNK